MHDVDEPLHAHPHDRGAVARPPPQCKAILLCQKSIIEAGTGNHTIVNAFHTFVLRSFPGRTEPARVFVQLTGGLGTYRLHIEVYDVANDQTVMSSDPFDVPFRDKLGFARIGIALPPLVLPHPGLYDLILLSEGREIDRLQFGAAQAVARKAEPPGAPPEGASPPDC